MEENLGGFDKSKKNKLSLTRTPFDRSFFYFFSDGPYKMNESFHKPFKVARRRLYPEATQKIKKIQTNQGGILEQQMLSNEVMSKKLPNTIPNNKWMPIQMNFEQEDIIKYPLDEIDKRLLKEVIEKNEKLKKEHPEFFKSLEKFQDFSKVNSEEDCRIESLLQKVKTSDKVFKGQVLEAQFKDFLENEANKIYDEKLLKKK